MKQAERDKAMDELAHARDNLKDSLASLRHAAGEFYRRDATEFYTQGGAETVSESSLIGAANDVRRRRREVRKIEQQFPECRYAMTKTKEVPHA